MGAGMTKKGIGKNPRVIYAGEISKRTGKSELIDSAPLVELGHGTLHYRYNENTAAEHKLQEKPHEGQERSRKLNYFYHTKLETYGEDASYERESDWKFKYVSETPESSLKKKVYYVYGKGI